MWIGKHLITGSLSISSEEQTASTSMPSVCREDIMQSGLISNSIKVFNMFCHS